MRKLILIAALFALPACAHADSDDLPPVRTVNRVDVKKYLGRWYEIASFPQRFQKDCTASTADYSLREDGKLSVLNQCRIGSPDGKLKTAKGVAYAVDETYAKLRVSFFWPFYGDYWIIDLDQNYTYAVVGAPGRDYLWILYRQPKMSRKLYSEIVARIRAQHFDISNLKITGSIVD